VNSIFFRPVGFLVSLTVLTVVTSTLSVRAEQPSTHSSSGHSQLGDALVQSLNPEVTPVATVNQGAVDSTANFRRSQPTGETIPAVKPATNSPSTVDRRPIDTAFTPRPEGNTQLPPGQPANLVDINPDPADSPRQLRETMPHPQQISSQMRDGVIVEERKLEKFETSAAALKAPLAISTEPGASPLANTTIAQENINFTPGQATRGGASYIGVGGNVGFSGKTGIGSGAFVVNGKIGLTRNISFRPAVLIGDNTDFLLPLTYDFVLASDDPFAPVPFAPFLGGGAVFTTNGNTNAGFLLTAGVDVPLSREFVANASINVGFLDDTNVGILLGVGYTFPNF